MSHHSVESACKAGNHGRCGGWVASWDTPGQRLACSCCCHQGEQATFHLPLTARLLIMAG